MAGMVGLGRKRRRTKRVGRRRRVVAAAMPFGLQKGRGFFGDLGSGIGSVFGGLGKGIGSAAGGFFGRGRSRTTRKIFV